MCANSGYAPDAKDADREDISLNEKRCEPPVAAGCCLTLVLSQQSASLAGRRKDTDIESTSS